MQEGEFNVPVVYSYTSQILSWIILVIFDRIWMIMCKCAKQGWYKDVLEANCKKTKIMSLIKFSRPEKKASSLMEGFIFFIAIGLVAKPMSPPFFCQSSHNV